MADFDKEPNEYGAWVPPGNTTLVRDEQERLQQLASSMPVIEDVIAWFNDQMTAFTDPRTIEGVNPSTNAEDIKMAVLFARSMAASYAEKAQEFTEQFREYIETRQKKDES